ncbi:type VI secretion system protein TssA [uncultured Massilia sp.]|uniref:type VI secretion system protein TssA n=1 Tax=uncultured Massilia sp. TaxID=169973 RepID=UPI0025DDB558|nr:type VI secretion system protein TssA [uncultured Massilia sp.]
MLNLETLLAPIDAGRPCGEDLAFSSEIDAIARARQADDPSLEQGAWVTELKEADWKFVARQCAQLIEKRSKDLQLAVWLAEAGAKTGGLRGLGDSLMLVAMLCERWWESLYPLPEDGGCEQRIGNLAWVAARIGPWLRAIPLTEGNEAYALADIEAARAQGGDALARLETARRRGSAGFYVGLMRDCEYCVEAIARLERSVDARLGAEAPGFGAARATMEDLHLFLKPLAAPPAGAPAVAAAAPAAMPAPAAGAGMAAGPLQTRVQALAQLRAVAEFFRRTEPHSPVAYLADKAAHWGEQPLHVWLRGLVKDEAAVAHIEEMLGVGEKPPA